MPLLLCPQIEGCVIDAQTWRCEETIVSGRPSWSVRVRMIGEATVDIRNDMYLLEDRLVCDADYTADRAHALTHWSIAPTGSRLVCDRIHTLSGQHGGRDENGTWHEPGAFEFFTATLNWTYAPAAPRILFYHGQESLLVGGTRLAGDYGLELGLNDGVIEHFRFNYGGPDHPLSCQAGQRIRGPRLQVQCGSGLSPEQAQAAFTQCMIADGLIPEKHHAPEDGGWRRPWYCTWADQVGLAESTLAQEQASRSSYPAIKGVLTQPFVEKVAEFIRRQDLNIGTIIIDDGWQDRRGDWNLVEEKFPDMRGLVGRLHEMGFRVALWWAPFLTEPGAQVLNRRGFVAGPTKRHGEMIIDYSCPEVRRWIEEKLEMWFGSGPGCWDFDGVKLDFLLEKIYPESQAGDLAWRGEETAYHHLLALIDGVIRRHKPSPGILHVPCNPVFAPFCAAVHGEERFDTDLEYIRQRPALMAAMLPGTWWAPHFNYHPSAVPQFIRRVKDAGGIVQVGKLLTPDVTSELVGQLRELLANAR